jgi:hypothetical protein
MNYLGLLARQLLDQLLLRRHGQQPPLQLVLLVSLLQLAQCGSVCLLLRRGLRQLAFALSNGFIHRPVQLLCFLLLPQVRQVDNVRHDFRRWWKRRRRSDRFCRIIGAGAGGKGRSSSASRRRLGLLGASALGMRIVFGRCGDHTLQSAAAGLGLEEAAVLS